MPASLSKNVFIRQRHSAEKKTEMLLCKILTFELNTRMQLRALYSFNFVTAFSLRNIECFDIG